MPCAPATLILLDELPPYFRNAINQSVGGGTLADVTTYTVSNLLSAALALLLLPSGPMRRRSTTRWITTRPVRSRVSS